MPAEMTTTLSASEVRCCGKASHGHSQPGEYPEDRHAVAAGERTPLTAQHNCIATDVDR
jgi:hypothetical protein